jgi:hypothetical protein
MDRLLLWMERHCSSATHLLSKRWLSFVFPLEIDASSVLKELGSWITQYSPYIHAMLFFYAKEEPMKGTLIWVMILAWNIERLGSMGYWE